MPDLSVFFNRFNISAEFYATQWCWTLDWLGRVEKDPSCGDGDISPLESKQVELFGSLGPRLGPFNLGILTIASDVQLCAACIRMLFTEVLGVCRCFASK